MKDIFFVRHGESNSNADGVHRGHESMLTETGRAQAELIAGRIEKLGVEALISSPWPRARDTATAINARTGITVEESELFRERKRPSAVVGKDSSSKEVREIMDGIYKGYLIDGYRHSDEENADDLRNRSNQALDLLASRSESRICVITHGLFLRVLLCAAVYGRDLSGRELQACIRHFDTDNTAIFHLQYRPNPWAKNKEEQIAWYIHAWNDFAHLG